MTSVHAKTTFLPAVAPVTGMMSSRELPTKNAPSPWKRKREEVAASVEGLATPSAPTPSAPAPSAPTPSAPTPSAPTMESIFQTYEDTKTKIDALPELYAAVAEHDENPVDADGFLRRQRGSAKAQAIKDARVLAAQQQNILILGAVAVSTLFALIFLRR